MPVKQETQLIQQLRSDLHEQIVSIRQRRISVEYQWLRAHAAWQSLNTERRFIPTDSSKAGYYLPVARRALERSIIRCVGINTPKMKWFETGSVGSDDDITMDNADKMMWYLLRKKMRTRSNINQLTRTMFMYGLAHLKTGIRVSNGIVWPTQRPVDPFMFYSYPETVSTIAEADIIFEDFMVSYEKYKTWVNQGLVRDIKPSELGGNDWPYHMVQRLANRGITNPEVPVTVESVKKDLGNIKVPFVNMSEQWLPREDKWYQVYHVWNLKKDGHYSHDIVGFFQSKYDEPTYKSAIHRGLPGETYTNSMMDDITDLQHMSNDNLNQFIDAVDWEQGFIAAKAGARRDNKVAKGRAIMEFEDPKEDFVFVSPPNSSTNSLRSWQIMLGLINSLAGTGTIGEGQPGRNMPRAGSAVNNLVNLAMADIEDVAILIEQEILTPSLDDIFRVCEFIPDHQLMRIPGAQAVFRKGSTVRKEDFFGDYTFEWIGANQFQDEQVRAQRMLIFLQMIPSLAPIMQQQGYAFNVVDLVKNIWRYSLGERSLSKVVVPIQQLQQQMQMEELMQQLSKGGNGVPGLKYNLPSASGGFVNQS